MFKILFQIFKFVFILIFPFVLLIRGSVFLHSQYELFPWLCILGGALFTVILLFIYFSFIYGSLSGKFGDSGSVKRRVLIAILIVVLYAFHGLFYIGNKNLKNNSLKSEVLDVHPILRLSVSTLIHLDKDLIITDADRMPEDYRRMGLKSRNHSLHYKQSNGYSHALDIRTNYRNEIRNFLVRAYFQLMGFRTIRHSDSGTTGDHLHVSLMSHDRPYAK
ncbi:MAG: hypothetical protein KJO50_03930 [Bacteroidia bacterium]|nr:hypothetical protein [Bacteroidia bacterium]